MTRRLEKNLGLLFLGEGSAKALSMVVFFFLGNTLGPARYGDLEFAVGVWFVLNLVLEAGLAQFGAREASRQPQRLSALIGQITALRVIVLAADLALLTIFVSVIDRSTEAEQLVMLFGFVLVPSSALLGWVFQARNEMGVVAVSNLIRQSLLAAGVLLIVRGPSDVAWVPALDACAVLVVVVIQWRTLKKRGGKAIWPTQGRAMVQIVRAAAPMAASSIVWALRLFLPLLALHGWAGSTRTGYFGAGHRMVVAAHTFVWLYFFNLLPTLSVLAASKATAEWERLLGRSQAVVCRYAVPLTIAVSLFAPGLLTALYGDAYAAGGIAFSIAALLLGAAALSGNFRYALIAKDRQGAECLSNMAGLVAVLVVLMVERSSITIESAALAFVVGELTTLVVAATILLRNEVSMRWALTGLPWLGIAVVAGIGGYLFLPEAPMVAVTPLLALIITSALRKDCPLRGFEFTGSNRLLGIMTTESPKELPHELD